MNTSSQQEPLLVSSHSDFSSHEQIDDEDININTIEDDDVRSAPGKLGDESPGLFIWLLTFSAGISGLLFGCKCFLSPIQTE